jgi:capsular polysaccharide transport system permease protein
MSVTMFVETGRQTDGMGYPFKMINDALGRLRRLNRLFLATVVIPTFLAIAYFGLIASDVYVSESRFVVRSPEKQSTGALGLVLKSAGFSNTGDEIYAVQDYALSRDALHDLNKSGLVTKAFSNPYVDPINRFGLFPFSRSFEDLYRYYGSMVKTDHDTSSSITTLTVRAYTADDAYALNQRILSLSETLVNELNARGRNDLIGYAQKEVSDAEQRARSAAVALSAYRNQEAIVDPEKQAQVQLQLVSKLQDELIATQGQLVQLRAFTPQNPQIEVLQARVSSLNGAIQKETSDVAGSNQSLAGKLVRYQRLSLESQFADRQLASAMASLEEARNDARRKQIYLERIVQPNHPDIAIEPRRMRSIFATFVLGLVAWAILTMLLAGLREHQD